MRNEDEGTDHVGYVVETGHPELKQVLRVSVAISRWGSAAGDTWTLQCEEIFRLMSKFGISFGKRIIIDTYLVLGRNTSDCKDPGAIHGDTYTDTDVSRAQPAKFPSVTLGSGQPQNLRLFKTRPLTHQRFRSTPA